MGLIFPVDKWTGQAKDKKKRKRKTNRAVVSGQDSFFRSHLLSHLTRIPKITTAI